jgi:predicted  nucleic acid-binding Zn-ribbon protein
MHTEEIAKMTELCRDYQLHSAYLDGTVVGLLRQVVNLLAKDRDSLIAQVKYHREDNVKLLTRVEELRKELEQLKQQDIPNNEELDGTSGKLEDLEEKSEQKLDQQTKDGN